MVAHLKGLGAVYVALGLLFMACGEAVGGAFQNGAGTNPEAAPAPETVATLDTAALDTASSGPLQLFDAHAHQMPTSFPMGWLESLFEDHDPSGIVLMGIGDVIVHQENYPTKVFAFSNFKDVEDVDLGKVDTHLKMGMRGIGEISIRHFASGPPPALSIESDFNEPELLEVYDLARQYGVPVNFHFDYHKDHVGEIIDTLPNYSDVNFIWAHAGDAQPEVLTPLLTQFDNLYIDISSRNPLEFFEGRLLSKELQRLDEDDGTIKPEWKLLFNTFSDRVLYGSDIGPQGRLEQYDEIQDYYRGILAHLDAEVAEKIAYKNAQTLFLGTIPEPASVMLLLLPLIAVGRAHRGRCRPS